MKLPVQLQRAMAAEAEAAREARAKVITFIYLFISFIDNLMWYFGKCRFSAKVVCGN